MRALRLLLVLALLVSAAGCTDDGAGGGSASSRFRNLGKRAASADPNPAHAAAAPER